MDIGACLLDSKTGDIIAYFSPSKIAKKAVIKRLKEFTVYTEHSSQIEELSQEELYKGQYDNSEEGGTTILNNIVAKHSETMTYAEGINNKVKFRLKPVEPLKKIRKMYEIPKVFDRIVLRIELSVSKNDTDILSFRLSDIIDFNFNELIKQLNDTNPLSLYIKNQFSSEGKEFLNRNNSQGTSKTFSEQEKTFLIDELNKLLNKNLDLADIYRSSSKKLSERTLNLLTKKTNKKEEIKKLNRWILEDTYPDIIAKSLDAASHSVSTKDINIQELEGGELEVTFPWKFERFGDYLLDIQLFLGPAFKKIVTEIKLQVRPMNPYYYEHGVADMHYLFTGHKKLLDDLIEMRKSNLLVLGSRRQGKSTLLQMLCYELRKNEEDIVVVDLTFDSLDKTSSAFDFIKQIFSRIESIKEYQDLLESYQRSLMKDFNSAQDALSKFLQQLPSQLGTSARLVVLVDEFNSFTKFEDKGEAIGSLISKYDFNVIAFGIPYNVAGEIDIKSNSGLPRFFTEKKYIEPLTPTEIRNLAEKPINGRYIINTSVLNKLCDFAQGRPFDAQVMLKAGLQSAIRKGKEEITLTDIEEAFRNKLTEIYKDHYIKVLDTFDKDYHDIAKQWRTILNKDGLLTATKIFNDLKIDEIGDFFWLFFEVGYVKSSGTTLHLPPALLNAWEPCY
jgi:hypothetical protein